MDLILYVVVLLCIGFYKMNASSKTPANAKQMLASESFTEGTVQIVDLPIGNNLRLYKEPEAYTLILQQFGLKR